MVIFWRRQSCHVDTQERPYVVGSKGFHELSILPNQVYNLKL